tara:strand:- start:10 stop:126 length:117 start_codon:yes stop_codon:yes gene_type:complete
MYGCKFALVGLTPSVDILAVLDWLVAVTEEVAAKVAVS